MYCYELQGYNITLSSCYSFASCCKYPRTSHLSLSRTFPKVVLSPGRLTISFICCEFVQKLSLPSPVLALLPPFVLYLSTHHFPDTRFPGRYFHLLWVKSVIISPRPCNTVYLEALFIHAFLTPPPSIITYFLHPFCALP